LLPCGVT